MQPKDAQRVSFHKKQEIGVTRNWGQIPIKENISIQPLEYVQLKLLFLNIFSAHSPCQARWPRSGVKAKPNRQEGV